MKVECEYCKQTLTFGEGVFQYTHGWCQYTRKHGANTVALPVREPRYACKQCIGLLRKGIAIEQQALF